MTNARAALILVLIATLAMLAWLASALPPEVASHFDLEGRADATAPRRTLLGVFAVVVVFETLTFLAVPHLIRRFPTESMSLPNRDYWLAPERREETLADLGARMTWLGVFSALFLAALIWDTGRANLAPGPEGVPTLGPVFWTALGGLIVAVVLWMRSLNSRFREVPLTAEAPRRPADSVRS
ncbi:MAG TPA: DUF1648 domain-containing protein [Thermoanaerobaculia bacterium]|nr:DUF1648 domain-containing protein [Thermoanaerobaculia bacterium]